VLRGINSAIAAIPMSFNQEDVCMAYHDKARLITQAGFLLHQRFFGD
jgi:hypothetical protein